MPNKVRKEMYLEVSQAKLLQTLSNKLSTKKKKVSEAQVNRWMMDTYNQTMWERILKNKRDEV